MTPLTTAIPLAMFGTAAADIISSVQEIGIDHPECSVVIKPKGIIINHPVLGKFIARNLLPAREIINAMKIIDDEASYPTSCVQGAIDLLQRARDFPESETFIR